MKILDLLNSLPMFLISGGIILFVAALSLVFLVRAYRAGIAIGMDKSKLKRTITSSATFTLLPSISILLGVIALSGSLGLPLPWLRLSIIGALHYETSVADIAAKEVGLSGLNISEMTPEAFTTIALLMSVGIIWGVVLMAVFGKSYSKKFQSKPTVSKGGRSFGDDAMTAMFIGLITAYIGSYIGQFVQIKSGKLILTGEYLQLIALIFSAAAMIIFEYLSHKKRLAWLENFSIAGSMIVGMSASVICGVLF